MKILLLDMDGVLVEPHGYHQALRETIALLARALGYPPVSLTPADISAFEAAGVASEWDSAAICAALLISQAWQVDPLIQLPVELAAPALLRPELRPPDFQAFARALAQPELHRLHPLRRTEQLLLGEGRSRTPDHEQILLSILRTARQIDGSLTHRIFQELILGSRLFARTYRLPPFLKVDSFLLQYDRPTLPPTARSELTCWLADPDCRAAIFTGRPSRGPGGVSGVPEAEQGASLAGLAEVPIAGLGGLLWLSQRRNQPPEDFLKPSPIHALAALRLAAGDPLEVAFSAAAGLGRDHWPEPTWRSLQGAQVCVFEDTVGGLVSVTTAQAMLAEQGVFIDLSLYGIAAEESKMRALEKLGAKVFANLAEALLDAQVIGGA